MTEEEKREKRNARRRKDPARPLEYVMLFISTMDGLLDVSAKQCQDYIGMLKYLAMHPMMGDFIPEAAGWSKDKCMRVLGIRSKISADCPLFYRENGGIRCTGKTIEEIAQLIEERITNRDNATGGGGVKSTCDRMDDRTVEKEKEEEEEEEIPFVGGSPLSLCAPSTPHPPTNNALPEPTAREPQPADHADQDEPPTRWGAQGAPSFELVRRLFEQRFQEHRVTDREAINTAIGVFWDGKQSHDWKDDNGEPVRNWMNCARSYADECARRAVEQS